MTESAVAIVGGGLAGLAAAVAAAERGMRVELFERSRVLGGRAGSFFDVKTGVWIDHCQHVALGCCTDFLDFCRRTGVDDCFERTSTMHFVGPDGRRHDFVPSRWLPAPLRLLPGLMNQKYLAGERWGIVRTLRRLVRATPEADADRETIGAWLRHQGQSDRAIERFWSVVLVSALCETVDRASLAAARMVFRNAFFGPRGASDLLVPRLPLREIFHERVGRRLADRGVQLHLATPVRRIDGDRQRARALVLADGTLRSFDAVIVAVPWWQVRRLFADDLWAALPAAANVDRIESAAITAVHLWFDRPITALRHAILVGRLSQWAFFDPTPRPSYYCQVVISASHRLPVRGHGELVAEVRRDLEAVWPDACSASLVHSRVDTQPAAAFSVVPGLDRFRPAQQTPIANLALAGDWTATGWPATMEGAVRSGYLAAKAVAYPRSGP